MGWGCGAGSGKAGIAWSQSCSSQHPNDPSARQLPHPDGFGAAPIDFGSAEDHGELWGGRDSGADGIRPWKRLRFPPGGGKFLLDLRDLGFPGSWGLFFSTNFVSFLRDSDSRAQCPDFREWEEFPQGSVEGHQQQWDDPKSPSVR